MYQLQTLTHTSTATERILFSFLSSIKVKNMSKLSIHTIDTRLHPQRLLYAVHPMLNVTNEKDIITM